MPVIIDVLKEKKIEERYAELFIGTGYEPEVCKIRGLYRFRTFRTYLFFVTLKVHQQIREIQVMILQVDFHKFLLYLVSLVSLCLSYTHSLVSHHIY